MISAEIGLQEKIKAKALKTGNYPSEVNVSIEDFCSLKFEGVLDYTPRIPSEHFVLPEKYSYCGVVLVIEKEATHD